MRSSTLSSTRRCGGCRPFCSRPPPTRCAWTCLFSSVAARGGNSGQADYAMANEVLNKVAAAEARRRTGCRVVAIGWGPWDGGMVTPALRSHFQARGIALLGLAAGAEAFVRELARPPPPMSKWSSAAATTTAAATRR